MVRSLKESGAELHCWSSGGAAYGWYAAEEVGVGDCFEAVLAKPHRSECTLHTGDEVFAKLSTSGTDRRHARGKSEQAIGAARTGPPRDRADNALVFPSGSPAGMKTRSQSMSTVLPKNAVTFNARLHSHRIPDRLPETYSTKFTTRHDVGAHLKVDDAAIRAQRPGFDGFERPFVMLPAEHNGQVTWYRHELQYRGPGIAGPWKPNLVDTYELPEVTNVDRAALQKYGVAVGLETNVGTIWAQKPGENFGVTDADTVNWR